MYKLKKLPSGLRIITVPRRNTGVFTLLVLIGTGSRYETKKNNGISHFLEHMFFKGTKHRPIPNEVTRELDGIGAQYNAFTGKEVTGYWVKAAKEHFALVLDVVSDIVSESLLKEEEIEKEKGVIIQELRMRDEDDPVSRAGTLFETLLWGDQPAGWPIIGTKENILGFTRSQFVDYFTTQYSAHNTLVVASGAFAASAEKDIARAFGRISRRTFRKAVAVRERQKSPVLMVDVKNIEATNLIFGARAFSLYSPKRFALEILAIILGGNMSSRLWNEIREKRGLAYYIRAQNTPYRDSGYFSVSAGVGHDKAHEAISIIVSELRRVRDSGVASRELTMAKDYIRGHMQIELEDSSALASFVGEQALFEKSVMSPDAYLKKIGRVTAQEITRVAREIFVPSHANLVTVGAKHDAAALRRTLEKI